MWWTHWEKKKPKKKYKLEDRISEFTYMTLENGLSLVVSNYLLLTIDRLIIVNLTGKCDFDWQHSQSL